MVDGDGRMRVKDKIAIITGAGGGLGEAMVKLFTREGARVVAVDLDEATLRRMHGDDPRALCVVQDIAAADGPQKLVDIALKQFGRLDILVNNAGVEGLRVPLEEASDSEWRRVLEVNLEAVFRLCRAAAPALTASGAGKIVSVTSVVGHFGIPYVPSYAAAKLGLVGLTRALAVELGPRNITVNCIAPGFVRTPITHDRPQERLDAILKRLPLGRFGEPLDMAKATLFLASDDAAYITGQTLFVDAGWSINLS